MKKGDKIFLTIVLVVIGMYVISGILNDFDPISYYTPMDSSEYLFGWSIMLGIPWIIYRVISHFKTKKVKNALQHA